MADQDETTAELVAELTAYVTPGVHNAASTSDDEAFIERCVVEALALVGQLIGAATTVPDGIRNRAVIEAGSELYHRRMAPNGISQYAAPDGGQLRVARDPMVTARIILGPFLPLGFA
ncbi:hypothetical protein K8F61_18590 [Microbacterium resistens]|uniref:Phage gp6-like head-tail connector protein n=1 Tax=Microbacterium resistens TaxID=156977 RepID=A0ABY3RRJ9_9MICO|nr:hypothetical protein [Microbacterium resistens]UGS26594.1 hypothetical protein K8F61_18590 [Microbacterium resistens]